MVINKNVNKENNYDKDKKTIRRSHRPIESFEDIQYLTLSLPSMDSSFVTCSYHYQSRCVFTDNSRPPFQLTDCHFVHQALGIQLNRADYSAVNAPPKPATVRRRVVEITV